ncbi:MAG: hypothetical protein LUO89_06990 [Methanothrix sp.]|nr:hypothetical protein [Methanothrix sp.]
MKDLIKPISIMLVGSIFVCVFMISSLAVAKPLSNVEDSLNKIKNSHSNFIHFQEKSTLGQLQLADETIIFPWASRKTSIFVPNQAKFIMPHSPPSNEKIFMNQSHSEVRLKDLSAMNTVKQRDLIYEDSQNGDPENLGLTNDLQIGVIGSGDDSRNGWPEEMSEDNGIEQSVDSALDSALGDNAVSGKNYGHLGAEPARNNLDIVVSGISTKAINTVEGGSAIATSNIIIKPVQVIVCSPEVEEKLK